MNISTRKSSKRTIEPGDEWLINEGYYRKTSPKNSTCLFRAVSEQIYLTPCYHIKVRSECVEFMRKNKDLFHENIAVPIEDYLKQLSCITEWGGINEIQAMSHLYKRDFLIFYCQKMMKKNVTNNGFDKLIRLCHTAPRQYETVYEKNFVKTAAYCQSIVYQTLYKSVFKMSNIDETIQNMLHDHSNTNYRHDKFFLKGNMSIREQLTTELHKKIENDCEAINEIPKNHTPFPYRVAKALDPNIFRNTEFDIWLELKRETRNNWVQWNNTELQVGGKCLVQMDYAKINEFDESNNNLPNVLSEQDNDSNENVTIIKNNDKSVKEESPLLIGHIQEMSKDEGPVLVFIEELGEKKIVPYASLKPLYEKRKTKLAPIPFPITHRKNPSFDHIIKSKKQWNSNTRKTKDSVANGVFTANFDTININKSIDSESTHNNEKNKANKNTHCFKTNSTLLKNFTNIEHYSINQEYSMDKNNIEVRPLSIMLDNPQPLVNSTEDSKEESRKKILTPANNKNLTESYDKPSNNNNNATTQNPNIVKLPHQSSQTASNDIVYPPHSNIAAPAMYSANLNLVCVSSDGNVYAPMTFYGGTVGVASPSSLVPPPPPLSTNFVDRANQVVNLSIQTSVDVSGSDLPYADIPTLRFFFNLGVECFHNNHMWASNNIPIAFASNLVGQKNAMLSFQQSEPPSTENVQQQLNNPPTHTQNNPSNSSYPHQMQNRRKNEQSFNSNRSYTHSYGNSKSPHSRMDSHQDSVKNRNESSQHSSYDFQKSKSTYCNHENQRDYNNSNWESRKNNNAQGRLKKNNEASGRNRNDRPNQYHDYQQRLHNNNQLNNSNGSNSNINTAANNSKNNSGKSESQNFQKTKSDNGHQMQPMNPSSIQTPLPASSPPYHQHVNQPSAAMYNVPYYSTDPETFFPPNTNMYQMPYIPHPDTAESGNNPNHYMCAGLENYPQTISPMYTPIPYSLPSLYSTATGPNPQENWYTIPGGQPHYIPYAQFQVSQVQPAPPPSVAVNVGTSSNN